MARVLRKSFPPPGRPGPAPAGRLPVSGPSSTFGQYFPSQFDLHPGSPAGPFRAAVSEKPLPGGRPDPGRESILSVLEDHPCFSGSCQSSSGRIHLPAAPRCNIFCRFCSRGFDPSLRRPGQAAGVIAPEEAPEIMDLALKLCPEIKVAGVAGPGDPLAGPEGLETLILIKERYPHLMTCLSTNGLALAESMDRILLAGVRTLTVTVNALEPAVLEVINRGVIEEGRFLGGRLGARRLIAAQEEGIRLAGEAGLTVKINMVLIPGVNDGQTERIAQSAREWGASLMNIIPLIPANDLAGCPAPTEAETEAAVRTAEKHLPVKRNCRRCRADACGIIGGEDYGPLLYGHLNPAETFSHG